MRIKNLLLGLLCTVLFLSCDKSEDETGYTGDGYRINGKVGVAPGEKVILSELYKDQVNVVDTVVVEADSTFTMEGKVAEPGFYQIEVGPQKVFFVLTNNEVEFYAAGTAATADYEVTGTPEQDDFNKLTEFSANFQEKVNQAQQDYVMAANQQDTAKMKEVEKYFYTVQNNSADSLKELIKRMEPSVVTVYATNMVNADEEYAFLASTATRMKGAHPDSKYTRDLVERVEGLKATAIGSQAPEISLPNPEGETIKLSSLRGKYVLIDFWASWCRPCRIENPNVVRMYERFKDKDFQIYGVSLDKDKDKWVEAIKADNLTWKHVSDLQFWSSQAAADYQVRSIPATFLIGPQGEIIAKNLRGEALERKLEEVL